MTLREEVVALRDRAISDLVLAHDYHADTAFGWDIVRDAVAGGRTFSKTNPVTGTITTEVDLLARMRRYVTDQLSESTFQQFLSTFESFLFDFLALWLTAYPQSLARKTVDFRSVLDAPDKDAIVRVVVGREVNELLYDRPANWFAFIEDRVKVGCPTPDEIERIAEAKASRDVLVHNRGVANSTYESKAGRLARYRAGERIDIPEPYHREVWDLLRKVVVDVSDAAVSRLPPP